jgi:hypothetical protein
VQAVNDSTIWILTADDWNAQIHVSRDGSSQLLHTVRNRLPERIVPRSDGEGDDFTEFRDVAGLPAVRPRDTHLCFAHELLWLLSEGAYDGLIIMATAEMMEALASIGAPSVRERVIARITMAAPIGNPIVTRTESQPRDGRIAAADGCFDFVGE